MQRANTFLSSKPAGIATLVMGLFALLGSWLELSFFTTLCLLPFAVLCAYLCARFNRGMNIATLRGVAQSTKTLGQQGSKPSRRPRFQLVAMPINHYGEKVRWSFDLCGIPYEESTVGGLLSAFLRGRSVPWVVDRQTNSIIGNSDECLSYVNAAYVPTLPEAQRKSLSSFFERTPDRILWEKKLSNVGHCVQGWAYSYLLDESTDSMWSLTAWGAFEPKVPALQRWALQMAFPLLKKQMREAFLMSSPRAEEVRRTRLESILQLLTDVDVALERTKFLTGDKLCYIDITFASLLAPLLPTTIPFASPSPYANGRFSSFNGAYEEQKQKKQELPQPLLDFEEKALARPCGKFIVGLYRDYRNLGKVQ